MIKVKCHNERRKYSLTGTNVKYHITNKPKPNAAAVGLKKCCKQDNNHNV